MRTTLGINEAYILAGLETAKELTVAGVAERVEGDRDIDDGSIYVALQRMIARGFVTMRKIRTASADGRVREIGVYAITGEGARTLDEFTAQVAGLTRLRLSASGA
jgi:DNA-binding PadR family transcriptional regulator